jgi:hypothetical protein
VPEGDSPRAGEGPGYSGRYRGIACALIAAALVLAGMIAPAGAQRAEPAAPRPGVAGVPATAAIGRITLSPAPDQPFSPTVPWLAHRPDGTLVDCAGTQTSCFQEAENEAFAKGWSLDVYGPGGVVVSGINAARGIVLHPLRQRYVALHGTIISCAPIDEPCLTVDSMVEGALILNDGAQITSTPKTASERTFTILFQPRTKLDPEGFSAIASSRIELGNVSHSVAQGLSPATVGFDASAGNIIGNIITANEINGAGPGLTATAHHALLAFGATPTTGFFRNIVTLGSVHLADQGVVQLGTSTAASAFPGNYRQNIVTIGQIAPSGGDAVGYHDFGRQNIVTIADIDTEQGPARFGVVLEPSATANQVTANVNRYGARLAGGDFQDRGTDNTVTINGRSFRNGNLTVLTNLPASCAGQPAGTVWNNKGLLGLCP